MYPKMNEKQSTWRTTISKNSYSRNNYFNWNGGSTEGERICLAVFNIIVQGATNPNPNPSFHRPSFHRPFDVSWVVVRRPDKESNQNTQAVIPSLFLFLQLLFFEPAIVARSLIAGWKCLCVSWKGGFIDDIL